MRQNIEIGKKVLLTTDRWFIAPDGAQYTAVHGTVTAVLDAEQALGVRTNARSTNWYVQIGNMLVAGCQIFYAARCEWPNLDEVESYEVKDGKVLKFYVPSRIYNADQEL
ncbi:hypothetical protein uan_085 [Pseudomonas phage UAntarctica]|nr:hypothetical protein uan_085 [Pseudomonas phage UAntarctica]